jgi:opacity protein-like surface antigen
MKNRAERGRGCSIATGAGLALVLTLSAPEVAHAASWLVRAEGGLRTTSNSPDTSEAIFGDSKGFAFGGGVAWEMNDRFRFGLDYRAGSRSGERAFAVDASAEAFRLGHPLDLDLKTVTLQADVRLSRSAFEPYAGVGIGSTRWKERSDIAGLIETAEGSALAFDLRAGGLYRRDRVALGIEGGMTIVPNAIGQSGISAVYREKDLGGFFAVVRLSYRVR